MHGCSGHAHWSLQASRIPAERVSTTRDLEERQTHRGELLELFFGKLGDLIVGAETQSSHLASYLLRKLVPSEFVAGDDVKAVPAVSSSLLV
ncbi:hypothetical protein NM688_g8105 [Phlebia brevispora]|uniref:Uncharacterized protein n=1 Tax=Phlebia brevispora TaxID=194682 RepID=A0ACC1RXD4_9APHY|nr:hypothetical protein NM688_g8105 [Phlebia brevispora]